MHLAFIIISILFILHRVTSVETQELAALSRHNYRHFLPERNHYVRLMSGELIPISDATISPIISILKNFFALDLSLFDDSTLHLLDEYLRIAHHPVRYIHFNDPLKGILLAKAASILGLNTLKRICFESLVHDNEPIKLLGMPFDELKPTLEQYIFARKYNIKYFNIVGDQLTLGVLNEYERNHDFLSRHPEAKGGLILLSSMYKKIQVLGFNHLDVLMDKRFEKTAALSIICRGSPPIDGISNLKMVLDKFKVNELVLLANHLTASDFNSLSSINPSVQHLEIISTNFGTDMSTELRKLIPSDAKDVGSIGPSFKNWKDLQYLSLAQNHIESDGAVFIISSLKDAPIKEIKFNKNKIGAEENGKHIKKLVAKLKPLSQLEILDLSENYIGSKMKDLVPLFFETTIQKLILNDNRITGDDVDAFTRKAMNYHKKLIEKGLSGKTRIKQLYMSRNWASKQLRDFCLRMGIELHEEGI